MEILQTVPSIIPTCIEPYAPRQRGLVQTLDALAGAAQVQLGSVTQSPAILGTLFYLGDGLQRAVTDKVFDFLQPRGWTTANVLRLTSTALRVAVEISKLLNPSDASLAWRELKNKLEIFQLVRNLPSQLGLAVDEFVSLPDLVRKAYSLFPFAALWAVEGVGHYYTDSYWKHKSTPHGLLTDASVPAKSLLMLHAGMGLAFADRVLRTLPPDLPTAADAHSALEQFLALCRSNSMPGYLGAAIESLGLVTRDFYPDLLDVVGREFQRLAKDLSGFFWHGVGRALYFSRRYFLPILGSTTNVFNDAVFNSPQRESLIAGLVWAFTLVNMLDPAIMENALQSGMPPSEGFSNGLISSVLMRQETTPDEEFISHFYRHQPHSQTNARNWARLIAVPVGTALRRYYPVLQKHQALDQLFQFQNLGAVVSALRDRTTANMA